jgi:hypothetical protein
MCAAPGTQFELLLMQATMRHQLLQCAAAGASRATADGAQPVAQAEASTVDDNGSSSSSSDSSSAVDARVAHVYRMEGLGTLTLEGALAGKFSMKRCPQSYVHQHVGMSTCACASSTAEL